MEILIDSQIRDWVFIPLLIAMFLFSLIRMNIQKIMQSKPSFIKKIKNKAQLDTSV